MKTTGLRILFFSCLLTSARPEAVTNAHENVAGFIESFVNAYELSPEGRYTHEYHPFLLDYTSKSLDTLEAAMTQAGLNLDGRLVIMGYEEQAMPQYQTNFAQERINDEAMRKNNAGWSLKLHNYFGFMTGFLFKRLADIQKKYPSLLDTTFQHIDADSIDLFDDRSIILQEHALGDALPFMQDTEEYILQLLKKKSPPAVLAALERFWHMLHRRAFRVGNQQIAGTQDVLFSIEYIKHLQRSKLPLHRFFIGPDLTYPIEITKKQGAGATIHAQHFAQTLTKHLVPVDNEPTVYIFCSFVDGVGKSTMLGNIKNWMQHGNNLRSFGHVDNSSSQLAEIFQYDENVFIADLPAQVSHFTYKPDGDVFVDAGTEFDDDMLEELTAYAVKERGAIVKKYEESLAQTQMSITKDGYFIPTLNDPTKPFGIFLKNVVLLGKQQTNRWIPFEYQNEPFLFKDTKPPYEIRCLIPLGNVRSEGLKNIEAEQMLFTKGVRFPYKFDHFLHDLTSRLKEQGVKHVRFVDFLSMYPRSSRENIRINYLLQQMAHLFPGFVPSESLYKDFVSGGELLYTFMNPAKRHLIAAGFTSEALVRYALFHSLWRSSTSAIKSFSIQELSTILQQELTQIANHKKITQQLVDKKISNEAQHLEQVYGFSKSFVNIQQLALSDLVKFSQVLSEFFTHDVNNEQLSTLWQPLESPAIPTKQLIDGERISERNNKPVMEKNSAKAVRALFVLHEACKSRELLTPALRMLRSCWYSSIVSLLYADSISNNQYITITKPWLRGIPLQVVKLTTPAGGTDHFISIVQPWTESCKEQTIKPPAQGPFKCFHLQSHKLETQTIIEQEFYRRDWTSASSNYGLLGFDCCVQEDGTVEKNIVSIVTSIIQKHQNKTSSSTVLPTSELWELAQQDQWWQIDNDGIKREALRNGSFQKLLDKRRTAKNQDGWSRLVYLLQDDRKPLVQLVVRLLATLEMVCKDPDANAVVRMNNHEDFKAAIKLIEHVVLPNYCNIYVQGTLFDDYDQVEPYPSWLHWQ